MATEQDARSPRAAAQAALSGADIASLAPPTTALTAAQGAAGNVNVGTHSWKVTFTKVRSESEAGPVSSQLNVTVAAAHASLTAVPLGPTGTTGRNIYRTVAGDTGAWKFVGAIADNTTTTFDDNIADASLGDSAPAGGQPEADTYQEHGRRGKTDGGV